ncbi:MAG: hypothetical protein LBG65_02365 [Puniceicoccales bacterium]|nr:hypothetical protein [Puniceicoccales bacterium]
MITHQMASDTHTALGHVLTYLVAEAPGWPTFQEYKALGYVLVYLVVSLSRCLSTSSTTTSSTTPDSHGPLSCPSLLIRIR